MTTQNDFEISGDLQTYHFAELLAEISSLRLSGSFRVAKAEHKLIVYFNDGEVIFAVSNARKFRLFDILLREGRIDKELLAKIPNFANDMEFAEALKENGVLTERPLSELFSKQVNDILADALDSEEGQWIFSPLSRLRSGVSVKTCIREMLLERARGLSNEFISARHKNVHETFEVTHDTKTNIEFEPEEESVLSRLSDKPQTLADIRFGSGLAETELLKTLYTLWFAGRATRKEWNSPFSTDLIAKIRTANLRMARPAAEMKKPKSAMETQKVEQPAVEEVLPIKELSLDEYLEQVEKAETHYDILGITSVAKLNLIRASYFNLAKLFHPDRYHRAQPEVLRRVEDAFSKLAQAHEALRNPKTRTAYDNQLRDAARDKKLLGDTPLEVNVQGNQLNAERAVQEFEHGRSRLSDGDFEAALPFLARAVHLAQDVARYHAFYGKALSQTENGRHKAEAEMQAAVKIEPNNTTYRLMLAEFFVKMKLQKRAEGELTRLLTIAPDHKEAQSLLDSLRLK